MQNIHVTKKNGKWTVKEEGNLIPTIIVNTQKEAIAIAKDKAKNQRVELIIHGENGRIREKNSYGNDPCPPHDSR